MGRLHRALSAIFPWALAVTLASGLVMRDALMPGAVTATGLLVGGLLAGLGVLSSRAQWSRGVSVAVWLVMIATTMLSVSSALSLNPSVSFIGVVGLNNGTALFSLGAVWFAAGIVCADARSLRRTLAVVGVAGGLFTAAAVIEALTQGLQRAQGAAAGVFENSNSLGEFLAVAVLCSVAWALTDKALWAKLAGWGLALVSIAGMAMTTSRTGALGLALGLAFAGAITWLRPSRNKALGLSIGVTGIAGAFTAAIAAASVGAFGAGVTHFVASFGTDRDAIWRSAFAHLQRSPVIGAGLQQFSAIIQWSVAADGSFNAYATNDPHNIVLAVLLGGGIVGLLAVATAVGSVLWVGADRADRAGDRRVAALVAAVPVVVIAAGLVNWVAPAAMLAAAAVAGAWSRPKAVPLEPDAPGRVERHWYNVPVVVMAAGAVVLAIFSGVAQKADAAYDAVAARSGDTGAAVQLEDLYRQWDEPGFISLSLQDLIPLALSGDASAAKRADAFLAESSNDAAWSADIAVDEAVMAALDVSQRKRTFSQYEAVVAGARRTDPSSGLWYALEAVQAGRLGLTAEARARALQALRFPMDEQSRALMTRIAGN